jgi:hypothetical protein
MAAPITSELMVGINQKIKDGVAAACEDTGDRPSQYCRRAIFERLVREGYLSKSSVRRFTAVPEFPAAAE